MNDLLTDESALKPRGKVASHSRSGRSAPMLSDNRAHTRSILFETERELRASAALAADLAATATCPKQKARYRREAKAILSRMPQSDAEKLLLISD